MSALSNRLPLCLASWNIAAINNNPFEYWMTHPDRRYNALMTGFMGTIEDPGERDRPVHQVFTDGMWEELKAEMEGAGFEGVAACDEKWSDLRERRIVSQFMKDKDIGAKRLASMPDRITNSISLAGGGVAYRPSVINGFRSAPMGSVHEWWPLWLSFFFRSPLTVKEGNPPVLPSALLRPIRRAKYPAITEAEEAISIPLSCLCIAVFDAILVHLLSEIQPDWEEIRHSICHGLGDNKLPRTLEILEQHYADRHVIFLQEAPAAAVGAVEEHALGGRFAALAPPDADASRDQNSIILLNKEFFRVDSVVDHTASVWASFGDARVPCAAGDILCVAAAAVDGAEYLLLSFHGDTNGLATLPLMAAATKVLHRLREEKPQLRAVFGLDGNTYSRGDAGGKRLCLANFHDAVTSMGLSTCWGAQPDPAHFTTFHARTYLQTQLNKACALEDIEERGDANLKDHIVFDSGTWEGGAASRDNTGRGPGQFEDGMVFPTLTFPSDHAILSVELSTS